MNLPLIHNVTRYKQHETFSRYESDIHLSVEIHFLHSFITAIRHSVKAAKIRNFLVVILNHLRSFFCQSATSVDELVPTPPKITTFPTLLHSSEPLLMPPAQEVLQENILLCNFEHGGLFIQDIPLRLASITPM